MNLSETKTSFSLECPLPELDFDVITLGHGSGGVLTHRLLDSGVFSLLDNEFLETRHDGALLQLDGQVAFTTDSYVVSPIFFPGGNIGDLAVNGTVNDLAMCGAIPRYLSLGFILEERLPMNEFWDILVTIKRAASEAGVKIVTGDTKVVERGKADKIFINTTGVGEIHPKAWIDPLRVKPGDKILISGSLANHGIAIMSKREGLEFETEIESDTASVAATTAQLLDEFGEHIRLFRDPTRGGVATVLTEIAAQCKSGIEIDESKLPVRPQVRGACEMLGLDPLYVANEGIFLSFVSPEIADDCLDILRSTGDGQAAIIGEVGNAHPGKVVLRSLIGGRRIITMLQGDQLPRIC